MASVDAIIAQALQVAIDKSTVADTLSDTAMSAAQSYSVPNASATFEPFPNQDGSYLDDESYNKTYATLIEELAARFSAFFAEYFPAEELNQELAALLARDAKASEDAAAWYAQALDPLNRGTGINREAENAIWNSAVGRLESKAQEDMDAADTMFTAAGYDAPPGALQMVRDKIQRQKWQQLGEVAANAAKHSVEAERENTRAALANGWEREQLIIKREQEIRQYRLDALHAVSEYIRVISAARQSAESITIASANQRAAMTNAAVNLFAARSQHSIGANRLSGDMFYEMVRNMTTVATQLASSAGQQAAAALTNANTSTQQIVHLDSTTQVV